MRKLSRVPVSLRSFSSIPRIDLSPYFKGGVKDKIKVADEFATACEEIGFLSIVNHNVDKAVIKSAWYSFVMS